MLMKIKCAMAVLLAVGLNITTRAQSFNLASYNIRFKSPTDIGNMWEQRAPEIVKQVKTYDIDVMGVQEAAARQLADLDSLLSGYDFVGIGAVGPNAIFYRTAKYKVVKSGHFWLTETPDKKGKGWDAYAVRNCLWAELIDKSGFSFYYFNAHFDHKGVVARAKSTALMMRKIDSIAGKSPAVFSGDLNFNQYDPNYVTLNQSGWLKNAYDLADDLQNDTAGTYNNFGKDYSSRGRRIDHIFLNRGFKVNSYNVLLDAYAENKYPSDHFPVLINIEKKKDKVAYLYDSFPEDFENAPAKKNYLAGKVKLRSGVWLLDNAVVQNEVYDRPTSGRFSIRMQQNLYVPAYAQMNFDLPDGASKVVIWYSSWAGITDPPCQWRLEYSENGGRSWEQTGEDVMVLNKQKQRIVFPMKISGPVRFRIHKLGLGSNVLDSSVQNGRLSIDDISIFKAGLTK